MLLNQKTRTYVDVYRTDSLETVSFRWRFRKSASVTFSEPVDLSYWPLKGETMRTKETVVVAFHGPVRKLS